MSIKVNEMKEARGTVLKLLRGVYPKDLSLGVVRRGLVEAGIEATAVETEGLTMYLADDGKEYVEIERLHSSDLGEMVTVRLTAKGCDLVDGVIAPDPGIDL